MFRDEDVLGRRIWIGGLNHREDINAIEQILRENFERFGDIVDIHLPVSADGHGHRGFGFITYRDSGAAERAIAELDQKEIEGRKVTVSMAQVRPSAYRERRERD